MEQHERVTPYDQYVLAELHRKLGRLAASTILFDRHGEIARITEALIWGTPLLEQKLTTKPEGSWSAFERECPYDADQFSDQLFGHLFPSLTSPDQ